MTALISRICLITISCWSALVLTDCTGTQPSPGNPLPAARANFGADAKQQDLVYASDEQGQTVYVFSYATSQLLGTLGGFQYPTGECVDPAGDVFITNQFPPEILEYAHGGAVPIKTLTDPYAPNGCAVDPKTGNLAVANFYGNVALYARAQGTPAIYSDSDFTFFQFCAYDSSGNLFVTDGGTSRLAELGDTATSLRTIPIEGTLAADSIAWDGRRFVIANRVYEQKPTHLALVKVGAKVAKIVGSVTLRNYVLGPFFGQFVVDGKYVIGPTAGPQGNAQNLRSWAFPRGGNPIKAFRTGGDIYVTLYGVVVSKAHP
jgi:DNA-binding beta-propeller fold protein YncE